MKMKRLSNVSSYFALVIAFTIVAIFAACSQPATVNHNQAVNRERFSTVPTPTTASETGFVYTANEGENSISAVDLSTGQVKTVPVRITPHNVQVSRDGRQLLVVGMLAGTKMPEEQSDAEKRSPEAMQKGRLLIFDAATMGADDAADIEVGREPAHVI